MNKTITFFCENEGYEDNSIEIKSKWTGEEAKQCDMAYTWSVMLPLLKAKVESCHLVRDDGTVMTDITELTEETRYQFDPVLQGFIGGILTTAAGHLRQLGNGSARTLSPTAAGKK